MSNNNIRIIILLKKNYKKNPNAMLLARSKETMISINWYKSQGVLFRTHQSG